MEQASCKESGGDICGTGMVTDMNLAIVPVSTTRDVAISPRSRGEFKPRKDVLDLSATQKDKSKNAKIVEVKAGSLVFSSNRAMS